MQAPDPQQHEFVRDRSAKLCQVCQNLWPASGAVVSKYHRCTKCNIATHTACRDLAAKVCPCRDAIGAEEDAWGDAAVHGRSAGQLAIKVLHAYDTSVQAGVTLYGVLKILPGRDSVTTSSAVVGDQDVVWDGKSYTLPIHPTMGEPDGHSTPSVSGDQATGTHPVLLLEIWRSMYLLLDQQLAGVAVSIEPLFRFPNITAERWFQLKDTEGGDWGMVLLQLTFMPQVSSRITENNTGRTQQLQQQPIQQQQQQQQQPRGSAKISSQLASVAALQPLLPPQPEPGISADTDATADIFPAQPTSAPAREPEPEPEPEPVLASNEHDPEIEHDLRHAALDAPQDFGRQAEQHDIDPARQLVSEGSLSFSSEKEAIPAPETSSPSMASQLEQAALFEVPTLAQADAAHDDQPRRRIQRHAASELSIRPRSAQHVEQTSPPQVHAASVSGNSSKPGRAIPDNKHRKDESNGKAQSRHTKAVQPGFHATTVKPSFDTTLRETLHPSTIGVRRARSHSKDAAAAAAAAAMADSAQNFTGVGRLYVFVLSVHRAPSKDNPNADHYVRVEVGGQELDCTHTVYQTPNPLFNRKFVADVKHFKTDIRLVLVDAANDRRLGSVDSSVFAIIQRDADAGINWKLAPIEELPITDGGRIVGHMQVKLAFEEDITGLFLAKQPHLATPAPDESFSVERLRIHIARAQAVVQWVTDAIRHYNSIMNWDFPLWTGFLLVIFVYSVLMIDAEYALCSPLFVVVFQLTWSLGRRHFGQYRQFWVQRLGQNDDRTLPFRPVAHLKIAVAGYKNLSTKLPNGQHSLPFVKVTYLPYGEGSAQSLLPSELLIGCTNTAATDQLPPHSSPRSALDSLRSSALVRSVASFLNSAHAKDAILHNVMDSWRRLDSDVEDQTFVYPILHPIVEEGHLAAGVAGAAPSPAASGAATAGNTAVPHTPTSSKQPDKQSTSAASPAPAPNDTSLVPWHKSNALLKFTIYGENPATFMASSWGHVIVPIRDLVVDEKVGGLQPEIQKWHNVSWTGKEDGDQMPYHEEDTASINIRAQMELRSSKQAPSELEIETSRTVQNMLDRTGGADKQQSSLSTIWNLRDNVAYVQNVLAHILDGIESFKNLLNWTHPRKTAVVYALIVATWIAFVNIPGRYLILLAGLYQFFKKWVPVPPDDPWTIKYLNLLQSIPNDDDLTQVYQREHEEYLKNKRNRERQQQRRAKLRLVFECQWEGTVKIKVPYWTEKFLVVQGHRLVWWTNETDLEAGKPPEGQLLLQGHTGTTHASPVDIRDIGDDARLVSVFGRDSKGNPEKRTFLCATADEKDELVKAIQSSIGLKTD